MGEMGLLSGYRPNHSRADELSLLELRVEEVEVALTKVSRVVSSAFRYERPLEPGKMQQRYEAPPGPKTGPPTPRGSQP